jgi:uncharacterized membrane protein YbhN (UPF0104 family)
LILLAIAGVPILPGVFNRLAARGAKPFLPPDAPPLPRLRFVTLLSGLAQSACGWFALGGSLLAVINALRPDAMPIGMTSWLICTAYVALSYVVGFITLVSPGGLGVREGILLLLLTAEFAPVMGEKASAFGVIVVLLLRLLWTIIELTLAGVALLAYWAVRRMKVHA